MIIRKLLFIFYLLLSISLYSENSSEYVLVIGTPAEQFNTDISITLRNIYQEAFSRIGYSVKFRKYPDLRSCVLADKGEIDGDIGRVPGILGMYSNLLPVSVSFINVTFTAYSSDPSIEISGWDELADRDHHIGARSGIGHINDKLTQLKLIDDSVIVNNTFSGLTMLKVGRIDLYIDLFSAISQTLHENPSLNDHLYRVGDLETNEVFMMLNKKHKQIIPELEKALSDIKNEGLYKIPGLPE